MAGKHVLVVSPHYDDVPLSLGQSLRDGLLSRAARVDVRVVFGRTNWSVQIHPTPGRAPLVTAWRRVEEELAGRLFGYRVGAAPLEEIILREGAIDPKNFRYASGTLEDPLIGRIEALGWSWRTQADLMWFCAGVGRHVDHHLVAEAGARMVRGGAEGICFYEERPYTAYLSEEDIAAEMAEMDLGLEPRAVSGPIEASTQARVYRIYRSQMKEYFKKAQATDRADGRTERVWVPSTADGRRTPSVDLL